VYTTPYDVSSPTGIFCPLNSIQTEAKVPKKAMRSIIDIHRTIRKCLKEGIQHGYNIGVLTPRPLGRPRAHLWTSIQHRHNQFPLSDQKPSGPLKYQSRMVRNAPAIHAISDGHPKSEPVIGSTSPGVATSTSTLDSQSMGGTSGRREFARTTPHQMYGIIDFSPSH